MEEILNPTFNQVPINDIFIQSENIHKILKDVSQQFSAYSKMDGKVAQNIRTFTQQFQIPNDVAGYSYHSALINYQNYFYQMGAGYAVKMRAIETQTCGTLNKFVAQSVEQQMKVKLALQDSKKIIDQFYQILSKGKNDYYNLKKDLLNAKANLQELQILFNRPTTNKQISERDINAVQLKIDEYEKRLEATKNSVQSTLDGLKGAYQYQDEIFSSVVMDLQQSEKTRLVMLTSALQNFVQIEEQEIEERKKNLEILKKAVAEIDITADIQQFIEKKKQPEKVHKFYQGIVLLDWHKRSLEKKNLDRQIQRQKNSIDSNISDENNNSSNETPSQKQEENKNGVDINASNIDDKRSSDAVTTSSDFSTTTSTNASISANEDENQISFEVDRAFVTEEVSRLLSFAQIIDKNKLTERDLTEISDISDRLQNLLVTRTARDSFCQILDEHRSQNQDITIVFQDFSRIFTFMLDICYSEKNWNQAGHIMHLGNTYYRLDPTVNQKEYLQNVINKHSIFSDLKFWEYTIMSLVSEQLSLTSQTLTQTWDEFTIPQLYEEVFRVHTIVLAQLMSVVLNMNEYGLEKHYIHRFIFNVIRRSQLSEDQVHQLFTQFNIPSEKLTELNVQKANPSRDALITLLNNLKSQQEFIDWRLLATGGSFDNVARAMFSIAKTQAKEIVRTYETKRRAESMKDEPTLEQSGTSTSTQKTEEEVDTSTDEQQKQEQEQQPENKKPSDDGYDLL